MQAKVLFAVQMCLIAISGSGQIYATVYSQSGVNISWFGFWFIFSVINWHLCLGAWRKEKTTSLLVQTIIHAIWAFVAAANVIIAIVYNKYHVDVPIIVFVSVGCVVTYAIAKLKYGVGLEEPVVRGIFSILCRVIPQLTLGYYLLNGAASSVSVWLIIAGHCTILIRLWMLRDQLSNRNALASFIADVANEISWIIATAIWMAV